MAHYELIYGKKLTPTEKIVGVWENEKYYPRKVYILGGQEVIVWHGDICPIYRDGYVISVGIGYNYLEQLLQGN